jgi:hypothetical protein
MTSRIGTRLIPRYTTRATAEDYRVYTDSSTGIGGLSTLTPIERSNHNIRVCHLSNAIDTSGLGAVPAWPFQAPDSSVADRSLATGLSSTAASRLGPCWSWTMTYSRQKNEVMASLMPLLSGLSPRSIFPVQGHLGHCEHSLI